MPRDPPDGRHMVTTDVICTQGYLPTQIEFHNASNCKYKDNGSEAKSYYSRGWVNYRVYYHKRICQCNKHLSQVEEKHFEKKCKWKRVIDEKTGKAVLYRRCFCTKMEN